MQSPHQHWFSVQLLACYHFAVVQFYDNMPAATCEVHGSCTASHITDEMNARSAYVLSENLGPNVGRYVKPKRR